MDPKQTTPELIAEIQTLRSSVKESGRQILELTRALQSRIKKAEQDEYTSRYLAFCNAHVRFSGGLEQYVDRTTTFDRLIRGIPREQVQAEQDRLDKEARDKARDSKRKGLASQSNEGLDDLASLFGEDLINATR